VSFRLAEKNKIGGGVINVGYVEVVYPVSKFHEFYNFQIKLQDDDDLTPENFFEVTTSGDCAHANGAISQHSFIRCMAGAKALNKIQEFLMEHKISCSTFK
jgi:hypothetical protein